jgi:hypothetical protein
MNQIERIVEVTGMPTESDVESIASSFASTMLESLPIMNYRTIPQTFPSASAEALDFLKVCFNFNPDRRSSGEFTELSFVLCYLRIQYYCSRRSSETRILFGVS